MVIKALMKLFGGSRAEETEKKTSAEGKKNPPRKSSGTAPAETSLRELEGFVDYVVKALVDYPDEVKIHSEAGENGNVIRVICRESDRGKIIGKKGKTIIALRALVAGAAGRMQDRVTVEVMDDDEEGVKA